MCVRARCCFCVFALDVRDVYASFASILMRIFPFFHNFAVFLFLGNGGCYEKMFFVQVHLIQEVEEFAQIQSFAKKT